MTISNRLRVLVALACGVAIGCSSAGWPTRGDPRVRLEALLSEWEQMRAAGGACEDSGRHDAPQRDCARLRDELQRLQLEFPRHPALFFAGAVLAYESGAIEQAQAQLDVLLARTPGHARAAVLRARIALEEGNVPFARKLLGQSIDLVPDDFALREAFAAVAYADQDWAGSERALRAAERLGAPAWRIAYHYGLIAEARGDLRTADEQYRKAVLARPDWNAPRVRIRGLWADTGSDPSVRPTDPRPRAQEPKLPEEVAGLQPDPDRESAARESAAAILESPVPVEPQLRAETGEGIERGADSQPLYFVQLPLIEEEGEARALLDRLRTSGYAAELVAQSGAEPTRQCIRVGPYATRRAARRVDRELEAEFGLRSQILLGS
jgi:cell division septation protein DedD